MGGNPDGAGAAGAGATAGVLSTKKNSLILVILLRLQPLFHYAV